MEINLNALKTYIDSVYGEDNGDVISDVLRCSYDPDGDLQLKVFLGSFDTMFPIATVTKEGIIYSNLIDRASDFYTYADEFLDYKYTIEDVYRWLLSFIICEYEDELSRIREVVTTLNELRDNMKQ